MPLGYSLREVLGYIAGAYVGSFVMTEEGKLRLVSLLELPPETNYLIDNGGIPIVFGSVSNNLIYLPYDSPPNDGVVAGVDVVVNEDGSITLDGTASEDFYYVLHGIDEETEGVHFILGEANYYLSDEGLGSHSGYGMYLSTRDSSEFATTYSSNPASFSITSSNAGKTIEVGLFIPSGTVLDNVTVKPMIRLASASNEWVEYDPAMILV